MEECLNILERLLVLGVAGVIAVGLYALSEVDRDHR